MTDFPLLILLGELPMNKLILLSAASFSHWAQAHDGHGLSGSHWHASDALGFVAVLVVVAAVWWARRK